MREVEDPNAVERPHLAQHLAGFGLAHQTPRVIGQQESLLDQPLRRRLHLCDIGIVRSVPLLERQPRIAGSEAFGLGFPERYEPAREPAGAALQISRRRDVPSEIRTERYL